MAKLKERLLLPFLNDALLPATRQHGFRTGHSTTTALALLSDKIAAVFNCSKPPRRTVVVALDMSKAFDSVDHTILLRILLESPLPSPVLRWMSAYLIGRQARTHFRNTTSSARIVRTGVPQGSAVAPTLFQAYLRDLPTSPDTDTISYADDVTVLASDKNFVEASNTLTEHLADVADFLDQRRLLISTSKSSVTLFTSDSAQYNIHPPVFIKGNRLRLEKFPKILGVTFDPQLHFHKHAANTAAAVRRRQAVKALANTTWGQSKETLLVTFKACARSIVNYAAPIWTPFCSTQLDPEGPKRLPARSHRLPCFYPHPSPS